MQVRIEAFEVFGTPEQTSEHVPKIFAHLTSATPLTQSQVHILCFPLPLWRIGAGGRAMTGIPKLD